MTDVRRRVCWAELLVRAGGRERDPVTPTDDARHDGVRRGDATGYT
jgi:hypothetical protein